MLEYNYDKISIKLKRLEQKSSETFLKLEKERQSEKNLKNRDGEAKERLDSNLMSNQSMKPDGGNPSNLYQSFENTKKQDSLESLFSIDDYNQP